MSEFWIVPNEVELHGQEVAAVAGQVGQAQAAGGTVTSMSPQAFGILCSFFTAPVLAVSNAGLASMGATQQALQTYATTLPAVAAVFEGADELVAGEMTGLRGELA